MHNVRSFGGGNNGFYIWEVFLFFGAWCNFYHYFVFQSFVQSNFSRQHVALPGDFVLLEWLSQIRCLAMLIHVKSSPRQSVTIKGELIPLESVF